MGGAHVGFVFDQNSRPSVLQVARARPATGGNNAFLPGVPNRRLRVIGYRLQGSGAVNVKFTDTTGADLSMLWEFEAREGCVVNSSPGAFEFETEFGRGIQVNLSASIPANVQVQYVEIE